VTSLAAFFSQHTLDQLLGTYGYAAVLAFIGIESTGIPFPGETMLIAASIYASASHHLSIVGIVAAASAGAILGDNLGYFVGRTGGYRLLLRFGPKVGIDERRLKLGRYMFMQHGGKVVFFGRFVAILRTYAAFLAGTNHMKWWRFFAFNATGGVIWASIYGFGYYYAADVVKKLDKPVAIGAIVVAGLLSLGLIFFVRRNAERLQEEAERALPGPLQFP
jgi:membrane protein DedA with SNARE-associated domain